ncbi:uncharacterized protein LOC129966674 [Argiope bruennichi]|uniref:uncharacterized protein LOC129966674 n=1 Tax=Argiope bruennichi TaxID=94029 RepID=UPI0024940C85|nr:uncharacterized protein LOC129966674 [Argiope bruennichi]
MGELSLYRLCILKTAWLLKNNYWSEVFDDDGCRNNPFKAVPPNIINDLLTCILQLTSSGTLKVTDLYFLLTSGRVEHFKLDDILLTSEEFVSILMSLSVSCQNLRFVTLRNVFFSDQYLSLHKTKGYMKKAALECVLSMSPRLESVESCIAFDLKAIRNCERLKVLKLNFVSKTPLYRFLEEEDGNFWPKNSLTILELFEDVRNHVPPEELMPILKYCPSLKEINTDVCRCLEFLHTYEMNTGTLDVKYSLEKCFLGNIFIQGGYATITGVHIATLTCPNMKDINVLVNDNDVVYALSNFQSLKSLVIQWESLDGGDFKVGVAAVLNKIGTNLKILHVNNFYDVNFGLIASKCPHLEELKVEFLSEYGEWEESRDSFKELKNLYVELIESQQGCSENTLLLLLSNCTELTSLQLRSAARLTDSVLASILQKNSLSKVKDVIIIDSRLSDIGVRNLIMHLHSLEYFHFSSSQILFEEAALIVHEINPLVIMRSDID